MGLMAFWVGLVAILATQNTTPISLRFLALESVTIPLGIALSFSIMLGMVGAGVGLVILGGGSRNRR
jgi:uncharacterized integral membrane protein